jgi:hypothetical protein
MSGERQIPWSAYREKWLRRAIYLDFYAALSLVVLDIGFVLFKVWGAVAVCIVGTIFFALDLLVQMNRYDAILQNKPRNAAALTAWIQLRPWQTEICCACGAIVHVDAAPWFPNPVDPGGGRFSIVCPCGIGYFKLKA